MVPQAFRPDGLNKTNEWPQIPFSPTNEKVSFPVSNSKYVWFNSAKNVIGPNKLPKSILLQKICFEKTYIQY